MSPSSGAMNLRRLIAPTAACVGQTDPQASAAAQEKAMLCLSNYAREHMRMGRLGDARDLDRSAHDKSHDILRCDSFSHYACGRPFTYWMRRVGYVPARCWRVGENIAWGIGSLADVRSIFRSWIHSPEHRRNILGRFSQIGIGLDVGNLDGRSGVHVWTQDFGSHCRPLVRHFTSLAVGHVAH
jgi:uncharacterized protein YkwD